jgi:hypothetical protein
MAAYQAPSGWMHRMIDRVLRKYYGHTLDGIALPPSPSRPLVLRRTRRRVRALSADWAEVVSDVRTLLPGYSVYDTSCLTSGYAYALEVIPLPGTPDIAGDYEYALAALGEFTGLTVAVSVLCPLYRMQAFRAWLEDGGRPMCRWIDCGSDHRGAVELWRDVVNRVSLSMRSFGYSPIPTRLFCKRVPNTNLEHTDTPRVKDFLFGPVLFCGFDCQHAQRDSSSGCVTGLET